MRLGPVVLPEGAKGFKLADWSGRVLGPDVVIARAGQAGYLGFAECKWCREDKIYETLWDLLKLAVALARTHAEHAYLIVGAPAEPWGRGGLCAELIADGAWTARELFEHYRRAWQWLLKATRALPRPGAGRDRDRAAGCGPGAPRRRARLGGAPCGSSFRATSG